MLIDDLRALQARAGYLTDSDLEEYSDQSNVPLYQIEAVVSFYPFFRRKAPAPAEILVCRDLSCHLRGATELLQRLEQTAAGSGGAVAVSTCSCLGLCDLAPAVLFNHHPVEAAALGPDLIGQSPAPAHPPGPESFSSDPYATVEERYGVYRSLGGTLAPEAVIAALKESGLRGMGGAGFPTASKWALVRGVDRQPKYVICNADESEPGTFKDRALLDRAPHLVLEGMLIAAWVVGASECILYIRHEYEHQREVFERELDRVTAMKLRAPGGDQAPVVRVFVSPGGYICGEETALLEALEGKRAEPRNKPPFPGTHGLFGQPTVINNVETFALVPAILSRGAGWYRSIGVNGGLGPKMLALSGDVERPGVYEVPLGTTIRDFLNDSGGGMAGGRALKAVMPGGASSGFLPPSLIDTPLDFKSLADLGSMLGSGAVVALDESRCMLDCALNAVRFFRNESCGKCVPCRAGSQQLVEILGRWQQGMGRAGDVRTVEELAPAMADASICGLGQVAPAPIISALRYWPDEILAHANDGRCPAGVCR